MNRPITTTHTDSQATTLRETSPGMFLLISWSAVVAKPGTVQIPAIDNLGNTYVDSVTAQIH